MTLRWTMNQFRLWYDQQRRCSNHSLSIGTPPRASAWATHGTMAWLQPHYQQGTLHPLAVAWPRRDLLGTSGSRPHISPMPGIQAEGCSHNGQMMNDTPMTLAPCNEVSSYKSSTCGTTSNVVVQIIACRLAHRHVLAHGRHTAPWLGYSRRGFLLLIPPSSRLIPVCTVT